MEGSIHSYTNRMEPHIPKTDRSSRRYAIAEGRYFLVGIRLPVLIRALELRMRGSSAPRVGLIAIVTGLTLTIPLTTHHELHLTLINIFFLHIYTIYPYTFDHYYFPTYPPSPTTTQ